MHTRQQIEEFLATREAHLRDVGAFEDGDDMLYLCRIRATPIIRDAVFLMKMDFIMKLMRRHYKRQLRFWLKDGEWWTPQPRKGNTQNQAVMDYNRCVSHVIHLTELIDRHRNANGKYKYHDVSWCFRAYGFRFAAAETILNAADMGISLLDEGKTFLDGLTSKRVIKFKKFQMLYRQFRQEDTNNGSFTDFFNFLGEREMAAAFSTAELNCFFSLNYGRGHLEVDAVA